MPRKKKRRNLGPRRKRMRRAVRLMSAATWLPRYSGKDVVKGYSRWYAVDLVCAIRELRMLGVQISAEREERVRRSIADRASDGARRRAARLAAQVRPSLEDDWSYQWSGEIEIVDADDCPF